MLARAKPFSLVGSNMFAYDLCSHLCNPAQLAALRAEALLDTLTEEASGRLSRLAAQFVNAAVVLVSFVVADRQFLRVVSACLKHGIPSAKRSYPIPSTSTTGLRVIRCLSMMPGRTCL
jgi:hypothetical protein